MGGGGIVSNNNNSRINKRLPPTAMLIKSLALENALNRVFHRLFFRWSATTTDETISKKNMYPTMQSPNAPPPFPLPTAVWYLSTTFSIKPDDRRLTRRVDHRSETSLSVNLSVQNHQAVVISSKHSLPIRLQD